MNRAAFVPALALLLVVGTSLQPALAADDARPPNIIFLLADDLGWTGLRCFGSDFYETPNLDQLAADGMKFTNAYAACTVCSPTRASIMTGLYPARLHLTDFIAGQNRPWARLRIPEWTKQLEHRHVTIAESLKASGYTTWHVGKWHLNPRSKAKGFNPIDHGFDEQVLRPRQARGYFLPKGFNRDGESKSDYLTDWLTDQALSLIDKQHEKPKPFFLYLAYHTPHTPIQGRADLVEKFKAKVDPSGIHRNPIYAAMVSSLDTSVGRILDRLEKHGIEDNTVVVFTSDNGGLTQRYGRHDGFTENLPLRRGKGSACEGGVRVPAIVRWPGVTKAGSVCSEPVMTIDYAPTMLDIADNGRPVDRKSFHDGVSLAGLFRDSAKKLNRSLYWHYPHYHAGGDSPYSAVRSCDWRLVEFHEDDRIALFNLNDDVGEQNDVAAKNSQVANRLRQALDDWRKDVGAQMPTPNPDYDPDRAAQVRRRSHAAHRTLRTKNPEENDMNLKPVSLLLLLASLAAARPATAAPIDELIEKTEVKRGIVAVLGLHDGGLNAVNSLLKNTEARIYFQSSDGTAVWALRLAMEKQGQLGQRVFTDNEPLSEIQLGTNQADAILVANNAIGQVPESELLRVLRPKATAWLGVGEDAKTIVKPVPEGSDDWSHPYHGPDNNPQSKDKHVKGQFRTQFIGYPKFSPMPEQSVVAGGRIYKAHGHIAHKANQNAILNTLHCISAYNGTILWKRPLPEGFMIHRNTMIGTDDGLYMGDHESCKVFDGKTGKLVREIRIPEEITDGPTWKWMALKDGILYALVGNLEVKVETLRSVRRGLGHWPWGMWKGHDYKDPRTAFGHGRTVVAVDSETGKVLWNYRDKEFLDARGMCMSNGKIYAWCGQRFLACIDAESGKLLWKNQDKDLLQAVGPHGGAQNYMYGYATQCYIKATDRGVFFAGPQRPRLVIASPEDGRLLWKRNGGNLQLVLRKDAIYAAGPQRTEGMRFDYKTGSVISTFPARRACTRATGCEDSIFFRATGGTVRVLTESGNATHIAPMRPPCQDGVLISNGHLYWGPWMCGCQLSLYGNIGLRPFGDDLAAPERAVDLYTDALTTFTGGDIKPLKTRKGDWLTYRGSNDRSDVSSISIPETAGVRFQTKVSNGEFPTAPIAAAGLVFVADRRGIVSALDASDEGKTVWKQFTSGPVYYPPTLAKDRLYVGSADGRVYCYEAATGRELWAFQVAPHKRRIQVFDKLVSRWPVAGGVVVHNGVVYAAAGITHYDGTYVVSLDAETGKLIAANTTSGLLSEKVNSGVSLQGVLRIKDDTLQFLGGGVYETARFDLKTLKCLNEPTHNVTSQFRTAFYPWYPAYGKYVSIEHKCEDGNQLIHYAAYEGSMFENLTLQIPFPPGTPTLRKDAAGEFLRRRGLPKPKPVWIEKNNRRFTSFIVSGDRLLATGHPDAKPEEAFLVAMDIKTGKDVWQQKLPTNAIKGGMALDADGRIFVTLENGELMCFGASD